MRGSKILAIEYYLPKKKENNKTLKKINPKLDIDRIKEKTGIDNRYISGKNETVIDISIKCSNKIFRFRIIYDPSIFSSIFTNILSALFNDDTTSNQATESFN